MSGVGEVRRTEKSGLSIVLKLVSSLLHSKVSFEKLKTSFEYYTTDMKFFPYRDRTKLTENVLRDIE